MLKRALICAVGAALVLTGVAAGKSGNRAKFCGASACRMLYNQDKVGGLTDWVSQTFRARTAPKPAPFFTITLLSDTQQPISRLVYSPSRRAIRIAPVSQPAPRPRWRSVPADWVGFFREATARLKPHATSRTWRPRN